MDARSATKVISPISARSATKQTRVLGLTLRDGALWAHFVVATPCNIRDIASGLLLELHPTSPPSRPRGAYSEVPYLAALRNRRQTDAASRAQLHNEATHVIRSIARRI